MESFGKFCITVAMIAVSALINGSAFSWLWGWFVSSKFGLPDLSIMEAYGLALTISMVTIKTSMPEEVEEVMEQVIKAFSVTVGRAVILVSTGWVVVQFI